MNRTFCGRRQRKERGINVFIDLEFRENSSSSRLENLEEWRMEDYLMGCHLERYPDSPAEPPEDEDDAQAQYEMEVRYAKDGAEQDWTQAILWFRKAAELSVSSQRNLYDLDRVMTREAM